MSGVGPFLGPCVPRAGLRDDTNSNSRSQRNRRRLLRGWTAGRDRAACAEQRGARLSPPAAGAWGADDGSAESAPAPLRSSPAGCGHLAPAPLTSHTHSRRRRGPPPWGPRRASQAREVAGCAGRDAPAGVLGCRPSQGGGHPAPRTARPALFLARRLHLPTCKSSPRSQTRFAGFVPQVANLTHTWINSESAGHGVSPPVRNLHPERERLPRRRRRPETSSPLSWRLGHSCSRREGGKKGRGEGGGKGRRKVGRKVGPKRGSWDNFAPSACSSPCAGPALRFVGAQGTWVRIILAKN